MTDDEMSADERRRQEAADGDQGGGRDESSAAARGPRAGLRLKAAREARNVSLEEIARELHLDPDMLRDLEANRFDRFSAPVFTKGYLRRYAGLVGVPEEEVLADFEAVSDSDGPPPVVIKSPPVRTRYVPSLQTVLVVLLVCVLGVLGWWAFSGAVLTPLEEASSGSGDARPARVSDDAPGATLADLSANPGTDRAAPAASEAAAAGASANAEGTAEEATAEGADAVADGRQAATAPSAIRAVSEQSAASAGNREIALTLSFTDECWLQVTDGDGERLYAGIARGGQVRRFSAVPPVSLVFGNADAASIEVDGEPYAIDPADRRGRTARITVSGS